MKTSIIKWASCLAALRLCGGAATSEASPLYTDADKSLHTMADAAVLAHSMLEQMVGASPGSELSLSGTFSDTGWSFNLAGSYLGNAVNLDFIGQFDPIANLGAHSSSGSVGTGSWSSSGSWSLQNIDDSMFGLQSWDEQVELLLLGRKAADRHAIIHSVALRQEPGIGLLYEDFGRYLATDENGLPIGEIPIVSAGFVDDLRLRGGLRMLLGPLFPAQPFSNLPIELDVTVQNRFVTGTVRSVPDHSSGWTLASICFFALLACRYVICSTGRPRHRNRLRLNECRNPQS